MSTKQISFSTELMMNFKQSEIVAPQKKFEALQTTDGFSLLFSISNDGSFYITQQTPGESTGWKQSNLSTMLAAANGGAAMKAKTFAVSQNFQSNKVDIALVVSAAGKDSLFMSLNNSAVADGITSDKIKWTQVPYDDPDHQGITLSVENLYIAETKKEQFIVVDISKKTFARPSNFLERYYIDTKSKERKWQNMVTGGDMDPGVSSMLGRKTNERVDGIYTLGSINGVTELLYVPLYNPFDRDAPPTVTRLKVPEGATAISTADVGGDTTDLFVVAGKSLYHYPAGAQKEGAEGKLVQTHQLFEGVKKLYACVNDNKYVVWGHNRNNQIFQTSCLKENTSNSNMWTMPIPLLTNVEQVSPYINIKDTSNAFFAVSTNKLKKAVQSPQTSIWDFQQVALKAPPNLKSRKYSSYTTRIQLTGADEQPLQDQPLYISSSTRTSVYINNLYYVLTPEPLSVQTDENGSITVVEELEGITGARLFVAAGPDTTPVPINPMDKPFNKIASLDTPDKLTKAQITDHNGKVVGPLVPDAASKGKDLEAAATANTQLAKAYNDVSKNLLRSPRPLLLQMEGNTGYVVGVGKTIWAEIGDIFNWLATGVEYLVNLVVDAATGVWNFIVRIGEQVYQGVLDCVEKVVGAIQWLYNAIKTGIEDLIKYLEFLFTWKDITRTKEVLKNLTMLFLRKQVSQIGETKKQIDKQMKDLQKLLGEWAGMDDYNKLGEAATAKVTNDSKPADGQTAPGDMLSSHFRDNVDDSNLRSTLLMHNDIKDELISKLFAAIKSSADALETFLEKFEDLATDMPGLSLEQILKRIIAIVVNAALAGANAVIGVMLDIFASMANALLNVLDADVYIPVVSDILDFFGVSRISMMDLFCWMAAIPFTIGYKIAHNNAPFKDDEYTTFFKTATKFDDVTAAFRKPKLSMEAGQQAPPTGIITVPDDIAGIVYTSGHAAAGAFLLVSSVISALEAACPTGDNKFAAWSAVVGVLAAGSNGVANFLIPRFPIKNEIVGHINTATTGLAIAGKLLYSSPVQQMCSTDRIMKAFSVEDARATGALVNCFFIIPALGCSAYHFWELSNEPASKHRSAAIMDETSNITSYISRICYAIAVNKKKLVARPKAIKLMTAANICTGGLQIAVAAV